MRLELVILLLAGFIIANIYTDGKYVKIMMTWKKYYQMAGVGLAAMFFYYIVKHNPLRAREMLVTSNEYIKYLPVDKSTTSMISPILDFTTKHPYFQDSSTKPIIPVHNTQEYQGGQRIMNSGKTGTKRSVSETKKKFVASRQNWSCDDCKSQLSAWFEVDHIVRLEHGGGNHVDNLVALCRECHGKKTAMENL